MQSWVFNLLGIVITVIGGLLIAMYNARKEDTRSKEGSEELDYKTMLHEFPQYMQMTHDLQNEINDLNVRVNSLSNLINKWHDWFDDLSDSWDTVRLNSDPPEAEDWMGHE